MPREGDGGTAPLPPAMWCCNECCNESALVLQRVRDWQPVARHSKSCEAHNVKKRHGKIWIVLPYHPNLASLQSVVKHHSAQWAGANFSMEVGICWSNRSTISVAQFFDK